MMKVSGFVLVHFVVCFICFALYMLCTASAYVTQTTLLKDNSSENGSISHFIFDPKSKTFYVGALNRLFKLSSSLQIQQEYITGPKNDNFLCSRINNCEEKVPTDNYNKVLLLDENKQGENRLVVCGSLFQGYCEIRDVTNISTIVSSVSKSTHLVANEKDASTVAVVVHSGVSERIIYIGASFPIAHACEDNLIVSLRNDIPSISMRKLSSDAFELVQNSNGFPPAPSSSLKLQYDSLDRHVIDYKSTFSINGHTYFLSIQPTKNCKSVQSTPEVEPQSKISSVCNSDTHFYSYVDVPLKCNDMSTNYNLVQVGKVMLPGKDLKTKMNLPNNTYVLVALFQKEKLGGQIDSAVCIYSMLDIQNAMKENIQLCINGNQSVKGSNFWDGAQCERQPDSNIVPEPNLCNLIPLGKSSRVAGIVPATSTPSIVFPNTALTSLTLTTTTSFTVGFLGTANGRMKKIVLANQNVSKEYDHDLVVDDGSKINQDTVYDQDNRMLYLTSQRLVAKVPVENCGQYTSCDACLGSRDPFCGWCVLENRCTLYSQCSMANDANRWTIYSCPAIIDISPPMASSTENITLYVNFVQIPKNTSYSCVFDFGEQKPSTAVSHWNFGASCRTPKISDLNIDFGPTGNKNATLYIRSEETGKLFAYKYFTFYDCASFTSCTSCTDNNFACDWCVYENKCTFRVHPCSNLTVFSRNQIYGDGIRKGPMNCPKIDRINTGEVYIHNNTSKEILIKGSWFPEVKGTTGYHCIIGDRFGENGEIVSMATRESDSLLRCVVPTKSYNLPREGKIQASLRITWVNGAEIENDNAQVTIYSCSKMAQGDCSLCKSYEESLHYLCRWCDSPLNCEYRDHCLTTRAVTMCPPPQVEKVTPLKGHYLGGTYVTITGRNLGAKFKDIQHNTSIAGVACTPVEELYEPARRIVCRLNQSNAGCKTGPVSVLNKVFAQFQFKYMKPILSMVSPPKRAVSGGALLTLHGKPIYLGTTIAIQVNRKICNITNKTESEVECILPASSIGSAELSVTIDGNEIQRNMSGSTTFTYVDDPTITGISPLKSFRSGGRSLTVVGTNINIIDHPKMFIKKNSIMSNLTNCLVKNSTHMTCPTPKLPNSVFVQYQRRQRATEIMRTEIGFIMDNVVGVRDLSSVPALQGGLSYYSDPEVYKFEPEKSDHDSVKLFKSEIVIINGKNLMVAAKREDVKVMIGNAECNVTNLSEDQIVCNPPTTQPKPIGGYGRTDVPAVVVQIGNRQYFVGYLEYEGEEILGIPKEYIFGAVTGVGLFIIVTIIVCCCIYRRQKNKSKRDFEKMKYQLDNMESNVRNECKQAFAELQTDMTDLTAEIGDGKKPLYRYDDYTFKTLFPQMLDHVVLHPPIPKNGSHERHPDVAICHFSQLLQNKQFLLKFIRTLEKQKSFGIRDRSNVASLLLILYQNNLEYITEIMKALLKELVEKSVEGKHPKLMLRRTESVVEKLLANWLALCMYKNLEESTGSSLYLLYQAIKFQVVKGPVDAVTGDARYSLSEDRLLRTENRLEPVSITLNVEYEGRKYKCRCLDCDTITQAKEKMLDVIYRNIPYSTRPAAEDLDLDWVNENKTLQDEDNTKWKENGWKQLNMLKDYKIPNGADVVLTQYQKCRTLPRSPNGSVHSSGFSYREAVPITRNDSEVSTKYWHLVKQQDDAQTKGLSSEIYLTRLLATKGTLKQYIDDFIKTVLTANDSIAPVVKYLFDFLDDAARQHNITDPEVAYTWKCNSLLLRFWVNIIKNPDFVFDIHKTNIVDSCLSVVAQCFMDSCSTSDQNLSKDSPSNKLLFAKDIPVFKRWVSKYFDDIQKMPAVSDQDLNAYLAEVSRMSNNYFTKDNALFELYNYVQKYSNEINESLEADSLTKAQQLHDRLGNVITNMEGPSTVGLAYV